MNPFTFLASFVLVFFTWSANSALILFSYWSGEMLSTLQIVSSFSLSIFLKITWGFHEFKRSIKPSENQVFSFVLHPFGVSSASN